MNPPLCACSRGCVCPSGDQHSEGQLFRALERLWNDLGVVYAVGGTGVSNGPLCFIAGFSRG
jgi:hypothetical protein